MWKNVVELDGPQITVWHMRIACWIPKATNTHSEDVLFIVFFFHCNSGCMMAPQCHIVHTLPVCLNNFRQFLVLTTSTAFYILSNSLSFYPLLLYNCGP